MALPAPEADPLQGTCTLAPFLTCQFNVKFPPACKWMPALWHVHAHGLPQRCLSLSVWPWHCDAPRPQTEYVHILALWAPG